LALVVRFSNHSPLCRYFVGVPFYAGAVLRWCRFTLVPFYAGAVLLVLFYAGSVLRWFRFTLVP
jgi:hypothetical protein